MALAAISLGFYRSLTLGSLAVTILSGMGALGSHHEDNRRLFTMCALVSGMIFLGSGLMWWDKSITCANYQLMIDRYTQLIDVKTLAQAAPSA